MTRHRWGNPLRTDRKTERQCTRCGIVKTSRHESEGGKDVYWTEFYSGLDRIEGEGTPVCVAPARPAACDARNYPL